ncbi:Alpha-ketoglutarate-dependent dioxygenase abh1 [Fusarium oxysporum f. sp. albedinis]|nr:Alpha-ketoglutarate-dependent dioxygenase abh1 [Fusarium oxysporum f. sp. albedinis]
MTYSWSRKELIFSEHETDDSVGENGHLEPETRRSGAFPPPEWHIFTEDPSRCIDVFSGLNGDKNHTNKVEPISHKCKSPLLRTASKVE